MKFLKSTLAMIALLAIGSAAAKGLKTGTTTTPTRSQTAQQMEQPQERREEKKSIRKPKTFMELVHKVKHAHNAWDKKNNQLSDAFINELMTDGMEGLDDYQIIILLEMAKYYHAPFTGKYETDNMIFQNCGSQMQDVIRKVQLINHELMEDTFHMRA